MNYVLDTNVLVAALRSPAGASAEILRRVLLGRVRALCSVPLFLEYEAVLSRPEQLAAAGVTPADVGNLLDVLAAKVQPIEVHYLWRPQLKDPNDDLVLEVAVNGQGLGEPVSLLTFNVRDFLPQAHRFGLVVQTPREYFLDGGA